MIKGIVSGYFNPLHRGHLEYIHAARIQCDYLIAVVNNDDQVKLKGSKPFMDEDHRCFIVKALRDVDEVMTAIDDDKTVCHSLAQIKKCCPNDEVIFFNSGDRVLVENSEHAELELCKRLGIKYVAILLPKLYSSSKLLAQTL